MMGFDGSCSGLVNILYIKMTVFKRSQKLNFARFEDFYCVAVTEIWQKYSEIRDITLAYTAASAQNSENEPLNCNF